MDFFEADWTISDDATLKEIKGFLEKAEAIVRNGHFTLSVGTDRPYADTPENYLFHHFRPTPHAFLDAKQVGNGGAISTCILDLGRYACAWEALWRAES